MHSADGEKIEAPEKTTLLPTTSPRDPEKQSLNIAEANSQPDNMPRIQYFLFALLILTVLGLTIASAALSQQGNGISDTIAEEKLRFKELLNSVEPSSLHEVLHTHMKDKYKHGIYQEDKHAMEVVHRENAEVAHSLIELAKRQSRNGTSVIVITTTAATVTETTTTATQTANVGTASDNSPPLSASQSSPPAAPSSTTLVQQTSSPSVDSTTSATPSSSDVKSSSGNATPASRSITQQILYTSTLPNGGVTTVTSLTIVPADQAQMTGGGTSTNTANASLQTNSATSGKIIGINGVLAALGLIVVVGVL